MFDIISCYFILIRQIYFIIFIVSSNLQNIYYYYKHFERDVWKYQQSFKQYYWDLFIYHYYYLTEE